MIDGISQVQLDYYPQQSTLIDLANNVFEVSLKPPLFKDNTQSGFDLLDPTSPARQIYFKMIGQDASNIDDFVSIKVTDNTSLDAGIMFKKSPTSKLDSF